MENDPVLFEDEYVTQQLLSASIVEAAQVLYFRDPDVQRVYSNRELTGSPIMSTQRVVFFTKVLLGMQTYASWNIFGGKMTEQRARLRGSVATVGVCLEV